MVHAKETYSNVPIKLAITHVGTGRTIVRADLPRFGKTRRADRRSIALQLCCGAPRAQRRLHNPTYTCQFLINALIAEVDLSAGNTLLKDAPLE